MHADEKAIMDYLKSWTSSYVSGKEIARKACGRKRYEEDCGWAIPILMQLVRIGVLETDHLGYFRIVKKDDRKRKSKQHVSPQILRILKSSGKSFDGVEIDDEAVPAIPAFGDPIKRPPSPAK